ncbi:MAG TPA: rhomboid family intramembrane serine protease [Candidatus Dependentiae bacterium]|nr:rhomboid family intramembrane serine protease [Candidatus Dependentiae bacterium]
MELDQESSYTTKKMWVPHVTYCFIGINIAVFVFDKLCAMACDVPLLFMLGAKINDQIAVGQYWRFLTPMFLHAGLMHLLVNMYSLYILGKDVELIFGRFKYCLIYLAAGLLGNVASFALSSLISVGASGAIFGLLGALLYLGIVYRKVVSAKFTADIMTMILANIAFGFMVPRIDNNAHIGGLIGGFLIAYTLGIVGQKSFNKKQIASFLVFIILAAVGVAFGLSRA